MDKYGRALWRKVLGEALAHGLFARTVIGPTRTTTMRRPRPTLKDVLQPGRHGGHEEAFVLPVGGDLDRLPVRADAADLVFNELPKSVAAREALTGQRWRSGATTIQRCSR